MSINTGMPPIVPILNFSFMEGAQDISESDLKSPRVSDVDSTNVEKNEELPVGGDSIENVSDEKSRCYFLSYDNLTRQTENEIEALDNRDYRGCLKWGFLNRISRAMQCLVYTPFVFAESGLFCVGASCCCLLTVCICPETLDGHSRKTKATCLATGASLGLAGVLAGEGVTNILCCPTNVVCPESGYKMGLQTVYKKIDQASEFLWKKGKEGVEVIKSD